MGWARLDDGFHDHPKLLGLPLEAVGLWALALTWAHRHKGSSFGLLGHIPQDLPHRFAGTRGTKLAAILERARLWDVEPNLGGWMIHDFEDYLSAADRPQTANEVRRARSEAGRRGARSRWQADAPPAANTKQADGKLLSEVDGKPMPPSRPVPNQTQEAKNSPSSAVADAAFDEFWQAYPRKVGKLDARKVWDRKVWEFNPVIEGAKRLRDDPNREPEFTPHPSTWLSRGGWTDDLLPARGTARASPSDQRAEQNLALVRQYAEQERQAIQ